MGMLLHFHRKAKRLIAQITLVFLILQVSVVPGAAATTDIVPDGWSDTNVDHDATNRVYDVTTGTIIGDSSRTALNTFERFDVGSGDTVNLFVPDGAQHLLNIVHSRKSTVDGVLNAIKDGRIGGSVYFLNPHGMVVGSQGVINVGSFHFVSPVPSFVDQFKDDPDSSLADVLAGTVPVNSSGSIVVQGTINTLDDITIRAGEVSVAGALQSGAEFQFASAQFTDVVNVAGFENGNEMTVEGGRIKIVASGGSVSLESDGVLFTGGDEGDIEIEAIGSPEHASPLGGSSSEARVTVDGATLIGDDISIRAEATADHTWDSDQTLLAEIADLLEEPFGVEVGVVDAEASSGVSIESGSKIEASGDVTIEASSSATGTLTLEDDGATGQLIGILYGRLRSDASATVKSGATIEARNLSLSATNDANLDVQILAAGSPGVPAALAVAVGDAVVGSSALIESGATIQLADTLSVNAENAGSFSVGAKSFAQPDGVAGIAATVSVITTSAGARVDADVTGLNNVAISAKDDVLSNVAKAETSAGGMTGYGINQSGSKVGAALNLVSSKIGQTGQKATGKTSQVSDPSGVTGVVDFEDLFKLSGAVTVLVADHGASANIGDGAEVEAAESVSVTAEVLDSDQQVLAISGARSSVPSGGQFTGTLGGALVVGASGHSARAWVGDGASVTAQNVDISSTAKRLESTSTFEWDQVKEIHKKLDRKSPWTDGLLTGMAETSLVPGDQGVGVGATLLVLNFDTESEAYVGENARIELTGGGTGLSVRAVSEVSGAFAAGTAIKPPPSSGNGGSGDGPDSVSVGGSGTAVVYDNATRAYIGKGAEIVAGDESDVKVSARTDLRQFAVAPGVGSGAGDDVGLNGNMTLSVVLNDTEAYIADGARVTARDVAVEADSDVTAFALSGGYHREGAMHLSASVAGQVIVNGTRAFVGEEGAPAGGAGEIDVRKLSVSARAGTAVDVMTTDSSNSAVVTVSVVDVDTEAKLYAVPQVQVSDNLALRAGNEQSFKVNATTAAKDGEFAGIASAILLADTDAVAENLADVHGVNDVAVVALDETTRTQVISKTDVAEQQSGGSGSGGSGSGGGSGGQPSDEELGDGTGESNKTHPVPQNSMRAKIEGVVQNLLGSKKPQQSQQEKSALQQAGVQKNTSGLSFPELGGAVTVVAAGHDAEARIGDGVTIDASGNVAVVAQTRQSGLQNMAETSVKSQGGKGSNDMPLALSAAVAVGVFSHGADAVIGQGASITAANVGVRSDVIRDYEITWDKWEGLTTITNKLNTNLGVANGFLTGYAGASGSAGMKELGITGSVLAMNFTNKSVAEIGDGSTITIIPGGGGQWTTELAPERQQEWDGGVSVLAGTELMGVFAAGKLDVLLSGMSGKEGSVALGGAVSEVAHINQTVSRIGENVVIGAQSGASAPDVTVDARTSEGMLVFTPMAGRGMSYGVSGNLALAVVVSDTQARVDDSARVSARDLKIAAEENIVNFAATGAFNQSEALGVGVGVSVQVAHVNTAANIGAALITAESATVNARTDGIIETISLVGAVQSSKAGGQQGNNGSGSWTDKVKSGFSKAVGTVQKLMQKKNDTSPDKVQQAGEALDESDDKSSRPDMKPDMGSGLKEETPGGGSGGSGGNGDSGSGQPGGSDGQEGPKFGVAVSGSSSVNVVVLDTTATIDGAEIEIVDGSSDNAGKLSVVAVTDTDIGAFSGGAALSRAKNPNTSMSGGVAGAVAVNVLVNDTRALVRDAQVDGARDVAVHALSGGEQVAVALGLAVSDAGKDASFTASAAGSVSVSVVANNIAAEVRDSDIRGIDGDSRGIFDVTAYDRTRMGTGGGSLMLGGKAGVGAAVSYTSIHNSTEALVSDSTVARFDDVSVRGLNAPMIAAGGAMGGVSAPRESVAFEGAWVISVITNSTSGRVVASELSDVGDVTVLARDVHSFSALDEVLDLRDCKGEQCDEGGHEELVDYTGSDVQVDEAVDDEAEAAQNEKIGEIDEEVELADDAAEAKTDEALQVAGRSGSGSPGGGASGPGAVDGSGTDDEDDDGVYFGGSSIVAAAGVAQVGNTNVGLSFVWSTIANDFVAEIADSSVEAEGDVDVIARSNATIIGAAVGAGAGEKASGAGSLSANHTANQVIARVTGTAPEHKIEAENLTVRATDRSDISSVGGSGALTAGGKAAASVGASVAFSGINNTVHAVIDGMDVDVTGEARVEARNASAVRTLSASGAVSTGSAAVSGSASLSEIANRTIAEIVSERNNEIRARSLNVSASDESAVLSISGQLAGGNKAAVGGAAALNWVGNTTRSRIAGAEIDVVDDVSVTSRNRLWIAALGASAAGSGSVSVNGSAVVSVVFNRIEAEVVPVAPSGSGSASPAVVKAGNLAVEASDSALIVALGGQGGGAGKAAVGGAAVLSHIFNTTRATLAADAEVGGETKVKADNWSQIYSFAASGGVSGSAAVNGSLVFSFVGNETTAEAMGEYGASLVKTGSLTVDARDASVIGSLAGSGSGANQAAVGGAANVSAIANTTRSSVRYIDVDAVDVGVKAENWALIVAAAVAAQAGGKAGVGGSLVTNVTANRTAADIISDGSNTVTTTGSLYVNAVDEAGIYTLAGGITGGGAAGVGAGVATNWVFNETEALIEDVDVAGTAAGEVGAESGARIVSVGATAQGGGKAGAGATISTNVVSNTTAAEVRSTTGNSLSAGSFAVLSKDRSEIYSIGVQISGGVAAIGATVGVNEIANTTRSRISGIEVDVTGETRVDAQNESIVAGFSVTAGGAAKADVRGSVVFSGVNNTTLAEVRGGSLDAGSVAVNASDWSLVISGSGQIGGAGVAAVGAAAAIGEIGNRTHARIAGAQVTASGRVEVAAKNESLIVTAAASAGGAGPASVRGSDTTNVIANETIAEICVVELCEDQAGGGSGGVAQLVAGSMSVTAEDASQIWSVAGQFGGAANAAVGGAIAHNQILNTAIASVAGYTTEVSGEADIDAANRSEIRSLAAAGGGSLAGASVQGSVASSHVNNRTEARMVNGAATGETGDYAVRAVDESYIGSISGQAALNLGAGAGVGAAVSVNQIGNTTKAYVSGSAEGTAYDVGNLLVKSHSRSHIDSLATGVAWGTVGAGVTGSTAIDLINNDTLAYIDGGADVRAQHNVGVVAWSDELIINAAGSAAAAGLGAGVGGSVTVTEIGGRTAAYIAGADTSVSALRAQFPTGSVEVASGEIDDLSLRTGLEMDPGDLDGIAPWVKLADRRRKVNRSGVAVNASATHQVFNVAANGGAGVVGAVNGVTSVNVVAGTTEAYIDEAKIKEGDWTPAETYVFADDHSLVSNFVGTLSAGGAAAAGAGLSSSVFSRQTRAYVQNVDEMKNGYLHVSANSTQSLTSVVVGGSLAGKAALAGQLNVGVFAGSTESYIRNSAITGGQVYVEANHVSETLVSAGNARAGGLGMGVTAVVSVSSHTTRGFIENSSVTKAQRISVNAESDSTVETLGASGGLGGLNIGGVIVINVANNTTESYVVDSELSTYSVSGSESTGNVSVTAVDRLTAWSRGGQVMAGVGTYGAVLAVTYVGNTTSATVDNSRIDAGLSAVVDARSERNLSTVAASAAAGGVSFNGVVAATLVGSVLSGDILSQMEDDENFSITAVNNLFNQDRIVSDGEGQNAYLGEDVDYSFSVEAEIEGGENRVFSVQRDNPVDGSDLADANNAGRFDVKGTITQGDTGSTSARVTNDSVIDAGKDIRIEAEVLDLANIELGNVSAAGAAVGAGVGLLHIANRVHASLEGGSQAKTSGGAISIQASAGRLDANSQGWIECDTDYAASVCALQGTGGLGYALGAAWADATVANTVTAVAKRGTTLAASGSGSIEIAARDTASVYAEAQGYRAAGIVAAGVVVARSTKSGSALAIIGDDDASGTAMNVALGSGTMRVETERSGRVRAYSAAGSGGVAGNYAATAAYALDEGSVRARLGYNVSVTAPKASVSVLAVARPEVDAESRGLSLSILGADVGASFAYATAKPTVEASIGQGGTIKARSLAVEATVARREDALSVRSFAQAASAAAAGISLAYNKSEAVSESVVSAHIGSKLQIGGDAKVEANNAIVQFASITGVVGGIGAVGGNIAESKANVTTTATVHHSVSGSVGGKFYVGASGADDTYAEAISGSGGMAELEGFDLVAAEAAKATTVSTSTTRAQVNASSLNTGAIDVQASHAAKFNGKVDSTRASVVGLSGAFANHYVDSTVEAKIGSSVNYTTGDLNVAARNVTTKPSAGSGGPGWRLDGHYNVDAGSGGGLSGTAAQSKATVNHETLAYVGDDSTIRVTGRQTDDRKAVIAAVNEVDVQDKVRLDSGDAISVALAKSIANVETSARSELGENVSIDSTQDIVMSTLTLANVLTDVFAKTHGASGAAQGHSESTIKAREDVVVGIFADLRSLGDISFLAGRDASRTDRIDAKAKTELYNKTALPIVSDPRAYAKAERNAFITIYGGSTVRSGGDINLLTDNGWVLASGYGVGTDLYRQMAEDLADGLTGADGKVSLALYGGSDERIETTGVTVYGELSAGVYAEREVTIDADGNVTADEGIEYEIREENLVVNLADRLDYLYKLLRAYKQDPIAKAAIQAEINYTIQEMNDLGVKPEDVDEEYPPEEYRIKVVVLSDIISSGGGINVTGQYFTGRGSLTAAADVGITIENDSPYFLRLNRLIIDDGGGNVVFNGAVVSDAGQIGEINEKGHAAPEFTIQATGTIDYDPELRVVSRFNPAGHEYVKRAPDIEVTGDVINRNGKISIISTHGNIKIYGVEDGISPNVRGYQVELRADHGGIMQAYNEGFVHVGGDPRDLYDSWTDEVIEGEGSIISGNNVFIGARYLNLNGLIQSGIEEWTLELSDSLEESIRNHRQKWEKAGRPVVTDEWLLQLSGFDTDALGTITAHYDPSRHWIIIDPVRVQGGRVELFGEIMNTGGGKIKVLDGYGRINIDSDLGDDLVTVIRGLDAGDRVEGVIRITDTAKKHSDGTPITTVYRRNNGNVIVERWAGDTLLESSETSGSSAKYNPVENIRYGWLTGREVMEYGYGIKEDYSIIGLIPWGSNEYDEWEIIDSGERDLPDGQFSDREEQSEVWKKETRTETLKDERTREKWTTCVEFAPWPFNWVCVKYKYTVKDTWETGTKYTYRYTVQADHPIDISFFGGEADEANVIVKTKGDVLLAGSVRTAVGEVRIESEKGAIRQINPDARIEARQIGLTSGLDDDEGLDIGTEEQAILVHLVDPNGSLYARTAGNIYLDAVRGDLRISGVHGQGNVFLAAEGSISTSTDPTEADDAHVTGRQINLVSRSGKIGDSEFALRIKAGQELTDGLSATALNDINVVQTEGDLRLIQVRSESGDVRLEVLDGSFADANTAEERDERTIEELLEHWNNLRLIGEKAQESVQQAIDAYVEAREREYRIYWALRGLRAVVDESGRVKRYEFDEPDAFDPAAVAGYAGISEERFIELHERYGSESYDPDFEYQLSQEERDELTEGAVWTEEQLTYRVGRSILFKNTTSTETRIEDPNIVARNISLIAHNGSVGKDAGVIVIDRTDPEAYEDEDVRLALMAAEPDDIAVDLENDTVTILLRDSIDVAATGDITIEARDRVYLGSRQTLYVNTVKSGDSIRIKGTDGVYSVASSGEVTISGSSLIVEGGQRGIGTADNPIRIDLRDGSTLTARASEDIYVVNEKGDLRIAQIFGKSGVYLTTPGAILHEGPSPITIHGSVVRLTSTEGGNIGAADRPLVLQFSPTGSLTLTTGGDIYAETDGNFIDVEGLVADRRIELHSWGSVNLKGSVTAQDFVSISSATGSVTQESGSVITASRLEVDAASGVELTSQNQVAVFHALNRNSGDIVFVSANDGLTLDGITLMGTGGVSIANDGNLVIARSISLVPPSGEIGGEVHLESAGTITQEAGAAITGTSFLSTTSTGAQSLSETNHVAAFKAVNRGNGDIVFGNSAPALDIRGISQAGSGTITVTQNGTLQITGAVEAAGSVAIDVSGSMHIVADVKTAESVKLGAGGSMQIAGVIETPGTVELDASGSIEQAGESAAVKAAFLDVTGRGGLVLRGANAVQVLRAENEDGGAIAFSNSADRLEIREMLQSDGGDIEVENTGGLLLGAIESDGEVLLSAGSTITQLETESRLTADTLRTSSVGGLRLVENVTVRWFEAENDGGDLVLDATTPGRRLELGDVTQHGGDVDITSDGRVDIWGRVAATGAGGTVRFTAAGSIEQGSESAIVATRLVAAGNGVLYFNRPDNVVEEFEAVNWRVGSVGNLWLNTAADHLNILGIKQHGMGSIAVWAAGDVTVSGNVEDYEDQMATKINAGGSVTVTGRIYTGQGYVVIEAGNDVTISGGVIDTGDMQNGWQEVTIEAGGQIVQDENSQLLTRRLSLTSAGGQRLVGHNRVGTLTTLNAGGGDIVIHNAQRGHTYTPDLIVREAKQSDGGNIAIRNDGNDGNDGRGILLEAVETVDAVTLQTSGSVTQRGSKGINAGLLRIESGLGAVLDGNNRVKAFEGVFAGGQIALHTHVDAVEIRDVEQRSAEDVVISNTGGSVLVSGIVTTPATVRIEAAGSIGQEASLSAILADRLVTSSAGGQNLAGANTVGSFAAINAGGGEVRLNNATGTLVLEGIRQEDGGDVVIEQAGDMQLAGAIGTDDAVTLAATGAIEQDAVNGVIDAARLVMSSVGGATLTAANTVGVFAATNAGTGTIELVNAADTLVVEAVGQDGGDLIIDQTGDIRIAGVVEVSDSVRLSASGIIMQDAADGAVRAARLLTSSTGGQELLGANAVGIFAATNVGGGAVRLNNASGTLVVEYVDQVDGGDVVIEQAGDMQLAGAIGTDDAVTLAATGAIEQDALNGVIDAARLAVSSAGGATLTAANTVGAFEATNAGGGAIEFTNAADTLVVEAVHQDGGDLIIDQTGDIRIAGVVEASDSVMLSASGIIVQDALSGAVRAAGLVTSSTGGQELLGANAAGSFAATNAGGGAVRLNNASGTLVVEYVGQVDGGDVVIEQAGDMQLAGAIGTDDVVTLAATGAIEQDAVNGVIDAARLAVSSTGGAMLAGDNTVEVFEAENAGGGAILLVNMAEWLQMGDVLQLDGGDIDVSSDGAIEIAGEVRTTDVALLGAASSIRQTGAGRIRDVEMLVVESAGGQLLTGDNTIRTIRSENRGGDVVVRNVSGELDVLSIEQRGGDVIVDQTGDLGIVGSVSTDLDLLLSAGGSIVNRNDDDVVIITARNVELASSDGSIGDGNRYIVVAAEERVNASAFGDIALEKRGGRLLSDSFYSEAGDIDLVAVDGIRVERMSVDGGVRMQGEEIRITDLVHTGGSALRLIVLGAKGMADFVEIYAASDAGVVFDRLEADYAVIDADADMLHFLNTRIGSVGQFNNREYTARIDNVHRELFDVDVQLYAKGTVFKLLMSGEPTMDTDSVIVNYDPDISMGSSGNAVTAMQRLRSLPFLVASVTWFSGFPADGKSGRTGMNGSDGLEEASINVDVDGVLNAKVDDLDVGVGSGDEGGNEGEDADGEATEENEPTGEAVR